VAKAAFLLLYRLVYLVQARASYNGLVELDRLAVTGQ
jgi:hypothetical protein